MSGPIFGYPATSTPDQTIPSGKKYTHRLLVTESQVIDDPSGGRAKDGIFRITLAPGGDSSDYMSRTMKMSCPSLSDRVFYGTYHALALKADGNLYAWGRNSNRQLGLGNNQEQTNPVRVGASNDWLQVAAEGAHTIALKTDGRMYVCGGNSSGQLGVGHTSDVTTLTLVGPGDYWTQIITNSTRLVAIKTDGSLWECGKYSYREVNGNIPTRSYNTLTRMGTDNDWAQLMMCGNYIMLRKTDGALYAWGQNPYGQLGIGSTSDAYAPTRVGAANDWFNVVMGSNHTVALKTDGSLWAWGRNNYGQIGLGHQNQAYSPSRVGTEDDWEQIVIAEDSTLAIKTDGTLWGWGSAAYGQSGHAGHVNIPTRVGADDGFVLIAGNVYGSVMALRADGSLWAWGRNDSGELGIGSTSHTSIPTRVGTDNDWAQFVIGPRYTIATKTDGSLWACGANDSGQLGLGHKNNRTLPTFLPIPAFLSIPVMRFPVPITIGIEGGTTSFGPYFSAGATSGNQADIISDRLLIDRNEVVTCGRFEHRAYGDINTPGACLIEWDE